MCHPYTFSLLSLSFSLHYKHDYFCSFASMCACVYMRGKGQLLCRNGGMLSGLTNQRRLRLYPTSSWCFQQRADVFHQLQFGKKGQIKGRDFLAYQCFFFFFISFIYLQSGWPNQVFKNITVIRSTSDNISVL